MYQIWGFLVGSILAEESQPLDIDKSTEEIKEKKQMESNKEETKDYPTVVIKSDSKESEEINSEMTSGTENNEETNEFKEYANDLHRNMLELHDKVKTIERLNHSLNQNPYLLQDGGWIAEFNHTTKEIINQLKEIKRLSPPSKYKEIDENVDYAMDYYVMMVERFELWIEWGNQNDLIKAMEYEQSAKRFLTQVQIEILKIDPNTGTWAEVGDF